MSVPSTAAIAFILSVSLVAAITDLRAGVIPNALTLPTIVIAAAAYGATGGVRALASSILAACVSGLVPYLLFRVRAMGGGDVKLFAALGALHGHDLLGGLRIQLLTFAIALLAVFSSCAAQRRLSTTVEHLKLRVCQALRRTKAMPNLDRDGLGQLRLGGSVLAATLIQSLCRLTGETLL